MVGTADVGPSMTSQNQSGSNGFGHQLGTVLVWFRRDLRVADNPALCAAVQAAKVVVRVAASSTVMHLNACLLCSCESSAGCVNVPARDPVVQQATSLTLTPQARSYT